jgi:hypothetical protein
LGIISIGEQADDLEAIRRTAAYQHRRRHHPFSLFYLAQRRMGALHWRLFRRQDSDGCLPDFGFGRCDGHHEMVDFSLNIEVTKKSPGCDEPGLQGGQLHALPILSKAQIHINGCPKNAGRCPEKAQPFVRSL